MQKLRVTVEAITGSCFAGCKVGDSFAYGDGAISLEGDTKVLCAYALSAMIPYLSGACRGTDGDWIHSVETLQCPDIKNKVVFKIDRV